MQQLVAITTEETALPSAAKQRQTEHATMQYRVIAGRIRTMLLAIPTFSTYLADYWYTPFSGSAFHQDGQFKEDYYGAKIPTFETYLQNRRREQLTGLSTILEGLDYSTPETLRDFFQQRDAHSAYRAFFARIDSAAHR